MTSEKAHDAGATQAPGHNSARRLVAEFLGTALLLATVVGSGIMGERLAGGNTAIALLANSVATGASLYALILVFGPLSGAHFNPVVTFVSALEKNISWLLAGAYVLAQVSGALAGVAAAHGMFELPFFFASRHERTGLSQWWSESVATFGLLVVILGTTKQCLPVIAAAVGAYITSAYWFTASTSFANPAVTLARAATDTFAGIQPENVLSFVLAQIVGALVAFAVMRWLYIRR
jgi:glycerol uptake facilitator-like aquaporin